MFLNFLFEDFKKSLPEVCGVTVLWLDFSWVCDPKIQVNTLPKNATPSRITTNSGHMKHTFYSKGCPNSHINTQCSPPWRQRRCIFSHANGQKGADRMLSCDRWSQASCTRCRNSAKVVAASGERVSSYVIMFHTCLIGERSGDRAGQGSCCTPRWERCVAAAVFGRTLSCWKCTSTSCRRNGSSTGLTICPI